MTYKDKTIYQIWPRSFYDTNGDGIGDIQGIIAKLDYLKGLGIDMIWLSPIYQSPNYDYGYDISNYYEIHPDFGTMEDFDELITQCKSRNIGLIMDLVANHTSDQHPWFLAAKEDRESEYHDYYYFKEGKQSDTHTNKKLPSNHSEATQQPPNNWLSFFGGSSWQYNKPTNEYYLTQFTPHQCDLNWNNPKVRQEIYAIMRFYLEKGIAGFRLDVINTIDKIEGLLDKDPHRKGLQFPADYTIDRPNVSIWLQEMHEQVIAPYHCLAIGECVLVNPEAAALYTKLENNQLSMTFHFDLVLLGCGPLGKFDFRKGYRFAAKDIKRVLSTWQSYMTKHGGYLGNYLSNHDNPRHLSRFGDTKLYRTESATCLALLNFTLYGTPFVYQGEEIGMTNTKMKQADWKDSEAFSVYQTLQTMMHLPKWLARRIVNKMTRDHARTPMQWSSQDHAGFGDTTPWMKPNPNYKTVNVETDSASTNSIVRFYQAMIAFRKDNIALQEGSFEELFSRHKQVFVYLRQHANQTLLVLINLTKKPASMEFKEKITANFKFSNYGGQKKLTQLMVLIPYEAIVYEMDDATAQTLLSLHH